nr:MAG TPA: hypothetical protein [Caudoviricetes sp.]
MLKIKDNVDLKELEKYGFKKDKFFGYILTESKNQNFEKIIAFLDLDKRQIKLNDDNCYEKINIKNLIKDGLVEKID